MNQNEREFISTETLNARLRDLGETLRAPDKRPNYGYRRDYLIREAMLKLTSNEKRSWFPALGIPLSGLSTAVVLGFSIAFLLSHSNRISSAHHELTVLRQTDESKVSETDLLDESEEQDENEQLPSSMSSEAATLPEGPGFEDEELSFPNEDLQFEYEGETL